MYYKHIFFFRVVLVFLQKKIFLEEVTSKYTTTLHNFGTFSDMLREEVSGGSMWIIRVLTTDGTKMCQFLGTSLFLQVTSIFVTFFWKKVSAFIANNILPTISRWHLVIFGCFMLFFPKTTILMNFKRSHTIFDCVHLQQMVFRKWENTSGWKA